MNTTGIIIAVVVVGGLGIIAYTYIKAQTQSNIIGDVLGAL